VLNACSAMETGGELIFRSSVQGENISIEIEDTGTGIDASILDKIFEPFVSTKETGTGLGLFISHEIVENHNGKIDVKTTLGKGTIFIVTLPLSARNP
jgi:two-component system, sporulation sensor kinase E